jgi:hypothetical protein
MVSSNKSQKKIETSFSEKKQTSQNVWPPVLEWCPHLPRLNGGLEASLVNKRVMLKFDLNVQQTRLG